MDDWEAKNFQSVDEIKSLTSGMEDTKYTIHTPILIDLFAMFA